MAFKKAIGIGHTVNWAFASASATPPLCGQLHRLGWSNRSEGEKRTPIRLPGLAPGIGTIRDVLWSGHRSIRSVSSAAREFFWAAVVGPKRPAS